MATKRAAREPPTRGRSPERSYRAGVALAAGLGALIAVAPLVQGEIPSPGDDSVYYSAAASLLHGKLPYLDYAFLHPPGVALVLSPFAAIGYLANHRTGFEVAHWFFALVVTPLNVLLVATLARRWKGAPAGVLAALFLVALTQTAVWGARLMEGTLSFLCLAGAWVLLGKRPAGNTSRVFIGGVLLGAACSVKVWAGLFVVAALLLPDVWRSARRISALLAGWSAAMLVLLGPFVALAPADFVDQVIATQVRRPAAGIDSLAERIVRIYAYGPLGLGASSHRWAEPVAVLLVVVAAGVITWALREGSPSGRFWATVSGLTTVMFLVGPVFFKQYPTFAGPPLSILFAAASVALVGVARQRAVTRFVVVGGLTLLLAGSLIRILRDVVPTGVHPALASSSWSVPVPQHACVNAEVPWPLLYTDRLPPVAPARYWAVDPAGGALADALSRGGDYESPTAAAWLPVVRRELRRQVASCEYLFSVSPSGAEAAAQTEREFARTYDLVWREGEVRLWRENRPAAGEDAPPRRLVTDQPVENPGSR
jgi:hypothetical protein